MRLRCGTDDMFMRDAMMVELATGVPGEFAPIWSDRMSIDENLSKDLYTLRARFQLMDPFAFLLN